MKQTPEDVFKDVGAIFDRLLAQERQVTLLSFALELLSTESGAFVLFMRLGDRDDHQPDAPRAFAVAGAGMDEPKLIETVKKWIMDP